MRKLFSTKYSAGAFNTAMLLLRIGAGLMMMNHGYQKLVNFSQMKGQFINFLGMGTTTSLCLVIFAEFFCSILIILGLFTRMATVPIIITMSVVLWKVTQGDFFGKGELAAVFLVVFFTILLVGPGKASVDGMIGK
jgi:putative oxidoreductase